MHQSLRRRLHPERDDPHGTGDVTHLVDRHHEQVWHAHDESGEPHEEDGQLGAPHAAVALPVVRVSHADVPEDGECDGEPDRHGVHDNAEAGVEEQEAHGRERVPFRRLLRAVEAVEVQCERQVGDHRETVGDREARQDTIRC